MFLVLLFCVTCVLRLLNCWNWQLSAVIFHNHAGCNSGSGSESIFSVLMRNARLMWNCLAGDFSSLVMTVSGKLVVFNGCER